MSRFNLKVDEATLLKTYRISSLSPTKWEDIDHDLTETVAGTLAASSPTGEGDPLGLGRSVDLTGLDMESRAAVLLHSKTFDPKAFLNVVHPDASYQNLAAGAAHLKAQLEAGSEALRVLVEENFDRFVAVKASADAVYAEMRDGLLADEADFGSKKLREHLKSSATKANQVYLPVLQNADKAEKLRSTLGVFERSKFFFNLPSTLMEYIEAGKYEATIRDYKKGKYMLETRPGQLLPVTTSKDEVKEGESSIPLEQRQKKILEKVWNAVERVIGGLKSKLTDQLKEPSRTVEEHEKTIEILSELDNSEDPVWIYFDSQHQYIVDTLKKSYKNSVAKIDNSKQALSAKFEDATKLNESIIQDLKKVISSLDGKQPEPAIASTSGYEVWLTIHTMIKSISEVLQKTLPNFSKIASNHLDGKYLKGAATGKRRSPSQSRTMVFDIIKQYISIISEFFNLSDMAARTPLSHPSASDIPSFVPPSSTSISTAHWLTVILGEVQECVNETISSDLAGDPQSGVSNLMETLRWRFDEALTSVWLRDANLFYHLEAWAPNPAQPSTTLYLQLMFDFQKHMTTAAFKIAGGVDINITSNSRVIKQNRIAPAFVTKITKSFVDSLYAFLDGLVHLASDEGDVKPIDDSSPLSDQLLSSDLQNPDTRLLIVVSNFDYLRQTLIPGMVNQLEAVFGGKMDNDRQTLMTVVKELDQTLFDAYVKPKILFVTNMVRNGVLDPEMDWFETPPPKEIRSYMYQMLLYLVQVHSQVSTVAKGLLERTLNAIVDEVANEAFRSFRQVRRFGMGGMLRATLEIEFTHQTLSRYVTPTASKTLSDVYNKISQAYARRPGDESLQNQLDNVKKTLAESRKSTQIEFMCFKPNKEKKNGNMSSTSIATKDRDESINGKDSNSIHSRDASGTDSLSSTSRRHGRI